MAPIQAGYVTYDALFNPKYRLVDFARMNDAIAVKAENERRAYEAATPNGD